MAMEEEKGGLVVVVMMMFMLMLLMVVQFAITRTGGYVELGDLGRKRRDRREQEKTEMVFQPSSNSSCFH